MQQAIFPWRQSWIDTRYTYNATSKVDAETAIVVNGWAALHLDPVTQCCPNAGHKLCNAKRL